MHHGDDGSIELLRALLLARNVDPRALSELARQGFVAPEFRARSGRRFGPYFKLRWREGQRQRTVYVGRDAVCAQRVQHALQCLQRSRRLELELARLFSEIRRELRQTRRLLERGAREAGFALHGYSLRRIRRGAAVATKSNHNLSRMHELERSLR